MERIINQFNHGHLSWSDAIEKVGTDAFNDVIPRFHNIVRDGEFAKDKFYEFQPNNQIIIKDSVFDILQDRPDELFEEIDARWGLLEGAFLINRDQFDLKNDIRNIYLQKGHERKDITKNIPFLNGYWDFYQLSNGGFYMAPSTDRTFHVTCDNMYEGDLSGDALGITSCLYAYSHLSFTDGGFGRVCACHYHRLREYMFTHPEIREILGATD